MQKSIGVQELNRLVATYLSVPALQNLLVQGEISGAKQYPSGHFYFTLKDSQASVSCVMFRSDVQRMAGLPKNGDSVLCQARVSLYERDGRYQLIVRNIQHAGQGAIWQRFESLKRELEAKGYFDKSRKKPLPFLPKSLGVVTSEAGAVIRDIVHVSQRRFPGISIILLPVKVQGEGAAEEIARAIQIFNYLNNVDLLIVGRGGGSMEDLWAFNEPILAEAIFKSKIPIISAVGHETDFSISDFVADVRAATPSAAAELAVPLKSDLEERIVNLRRALDRSLQIQIESKSNSYLTLTERLDRAINRKLELENQRLDRLQGNPVFFSPGHSIQLRRANLSALLQKLVKNFEKEINLEKQKLELFIQKIELLNPFHLLNKGYIAVRNEDGKAISKAEGLVKGDILDLLFVDGQVKSKVEEIQIK